MKNGYPVQGVGTCVECGKQCFPSRKRAKEVARKVHPNEHLGAYKCGNYWHYGHLPDNVMRGKLTRGEIR